jgi:c-di-GMP-binding flagellar brake protein YcgR
MAWNNPERRQFVRVNFPCRIVLHKPQEHIISTKVKDVSTGGIRIVIAEKLETSSLVNLTIYGLAKRPITCRGRIKWAFSRKNSKDNNSYLFDTGIEFHKINDQDLKKIKSIVALKLSDSREYD